MSRRFFSERPVSSDVVRLEGAEAHHLIHVMRAAVDDSVVVFDGTGWEFVAVVQHVGRKDVTLGIESRQQIDRELGSPLVLAAALPRGDRQEWLVQKAVELGVSRLVPWQTERGVARPQPKSLARLRRAVIESSKQCGRNRLMEIEEPCSFADYLPTASDHESILAHVPDASHPSPSLRTGQPRDPMATRQIGIGPEGGFTDQEIRMAESAGWQIVSLGPRILRTETAALAVTVLLTMADESVRP